MPNSSHSTEDVMWMQKALDLAIKAGQEDEVPIGAIIVNDQNQIVGQGYNQRESLKQTCAHAEILAIQEANHKSKNWRLVDCRMYVTLEPCIMCAGAIYQARIQKVFFAALDPKMGALSSLYSIHQDSRLNHQFEIQSGLLHEESQKLIKDFFANKRKQQNKS